MSGHYPEQATRHHNSSLDYASNTHTHRNSNRYSTSSNIDSNYAPPQRPQRAKRAIPDPTATSISSSLSQISLQDHSSLPYNHHHASSNKDLPDPARPNRRSNRDFRIIPANEVETISETQPQESIRQLPQKSPSRPPSVSLTQGTYSHTRTYQQQQPLQLNNVDEEDDEDSYLGDLIDKYCNSDEDVPSPTTLPPISIPDRRASTANDQLPTPPSSRSSLLPLVPPPRRGTAGASMQAVSPGQDSSSSDSFGTRSRNNSTSGLSPTPSFASSFSSSPVIPATAKLSVQHTGSSRDGHEALTNLATPSSSPSQSPSPSTMRTYTKRPLPPPKDTPTTATSQQNTISGTWNHPNASISDLRDSRSDSLAKDNIRRAFPSDSNNDNHHNNSITNNNRHAINHRSSNQNATSQAPLLSLNHHLSSSHPISSFAEAVEATMNRHRAAPPIPDSHSANSRSNSYIPSSSHTRERSSSHSHSNNTSFYSGQDKERENSQSYLPHPRHESTGSRSKYEQGHSHVQVRSRSLPPQSRFDHQSHLQSSQQHNSTPMQDTPYRMHEQGQGSSSQLEHTVGKSTMSSRSSNQAYSYSGERIRAQSHTSISTNTSPARYGSSNGLKPALLKTPIARARAKESKGSRKVVFGDMITIVTIERTPTPPPVAPLDKKAKKKLLQSKKASSKDGKGQMQNFDPEYDAKYYDAPYTPTPAEVVITTAPWIGNPNWDEERQNSKFYYQDDIDYDSDDYEYELPADSDIRLGPEDEDEDDEDEDEDDEEYQARPWGRGIAGPGGALPKKKSGMFKFKRAVNRLLRN